MTEKRKLNIGALPGPTDDYSHFEENRLRWDRIALVVVAGISIVIMLYALFSGNKKTPPLSQGVTVEIPQAETIDSASRPSEQKPTTAPVPIPKIQPPEKSAPSPQMIDRVETPATTMTATGSPEIAVSSEKTLPNSPLQISHPGITRAQLSSSLKGGQPVDRLGQNISMSGQSIIKVVLFTEMTGLRGTALYHDWYRNGSHQARVKIPVNGSPQHSSSSKFINQQMLGRWQVNVTDEHETLFLQADFDVIE